MKVNRRKRKDDGKIEVNMVKYILYMVKGAKNKDKNGT
jgi:hypothetical protein